MKIERSGPGLEKLLQVLADLKGKSIEVGFIDKKKYVKKQPKTNRRRGGSNSEPPLIAMVAAVHEFGRGVPQRSFFRPTVVSKKEDWAVNMAKGIMAAIKGNTTVDDALTQVGAAAAGDVMEAIIAIDSPPLDPKTIKRKGFNSVLEDTNQMKNAVSYKVISS